MIGPPANITLNHMIASRYSIVCLLTLSHRYILHCLVFILKLSKIDSHSLNSELICSLLTPKVLNVSGLLYLFNFFLIKALFVCDPVSYLAMNHDLLIIIVDSVNFVTYTTFFFAKIFYSYNSCFPDFAKVMIFTMDFDLDLDEIQPNIFDKILRIFNKSITVSLLILVLIITIGSYIKRRNFENSRPKVFTIARRQKNNAVVPVPVIGQYSNIKKPNYFKLKV